MTATTGTNADYSRAFDLLKKVYADKVEDLVPETDRLSKDIPFISADKENGQDYTQPVTLTREGGVTHSNDGSIFTLNQPLAAKELSAAIRGSEIVIRSALSYKFLNTALKQLNGTKAGARAFVNATRDRFEKLSKGGSYFRELALLYGAGGTPSGGIWSNLGVVLNTTGSASTTLVVQMAAKHYATAIWSGSEELEFDIFSAAGTKRNAAGTGSTTVFKMVSTDPSTYRVTYTSDAANVSAVVADDQIFVAGSRSKEMLGYVAAANTQSASLWGINTASYYLWRPTVIPVNGAMTYAAVAEGGAIASATGHYGDYSLYVSGAAFADITNDQTALISHTNKTSGSITIGFDDVKFKTQSGTVTLKVHPYMKRGLALGLPDDLCKRVGSTDLTHTMPGFGKMFRELENAAGVEMRLYTDQAAFCSNPHHIQLYTEIQNTSD